jgi:O-antigen/teichoic acid export membrane protein
MGTQQTVRVALDSRPLAVDAPVVSRSLHSDFARHAVIHTIANLGTLACSGALAFVLPRFLSVDDYGYFRLFLLYGSFAGILHLGFLDGLLMRWASRPKSRLKNELSASFLFLGLEHAAILIPLIFAVGIFSNRTYLWLAVTIAIYSVLWNWAVLGQYAIQALKLFEHVSFFTILAPLLLLVAALGLRHFGRFTLQTLIVACLLSNLIAAASLWMFARHRVPNHPYQPRAFWAIGTTNLRLGWSVVCANLLAAVALSLDRLVLSRGFSIRDFAIYSFAANALALTYNMILSVARVLFPYLSDGISADLRVRAYSTGETVLLLIWAAGLGAFFPIAWIISRWLPNYMESLPLIRILMLATGLTASIHVLHSTYFRVVRKQNRFLVGALVGLASGALLLAIGARTGQLTHFAWAMVGSALSWWLVNELLLRDVLHHNVGKIFRTLGLTVLCACVFLFCAGLHNSFAGFAFYLTWTAILFALVGRPVLRHVRIPGLRFFYAAPSDHAPLN